MKVPTLSDEGILTRMAPVSSAWYTADAESDLVDPVSHVGSPEELERWALARALKKRIQRPRAIFELNKSDVIGPLTTGGVAAGKGAIAALVAGVPIGPAAAGAGGLAMATSSVAGRARDIVDKALYSQWSANLNRATRNTSIGKRMKARLDADPDAKDAVNEYLTAYKYPYSGLEVGASYGGLVGAALGGWLRYAGGTTPYSGLVRGGIAGLGIGAVAGGAAGLIYKLLQQRRLRRAMRRVYGDG